MLRIYTTAEVVLGEVENTVFERAHCEKSGWPELLIKKEEGGN